MSEGHKDQFTRLGLMVVPLITAACVGVHAGPPMIAEAVLRLREFLNSCPSSAAPLVMRGDEVRFLAVLAEAPAGEPELG